MFNSSRELLVLTEEVAVCRDVEGDPERLGAEVVGDAREVEERRVPHPGARVPDAADIGGVRHEVRGPQQHRRELRGMAKCGVRRAEGTHRDPTDRSVAAEGADVEGGVHPVHEVPRDEGPPFPLGLGNRIHPLRVGPRRGSIGRRDDEHRLDLVVVDERVELCLQVEGPEHLATAAGDAVEEVEDGIADTRCRIARRQVDVHLDRLAKGSGGDVIDDDPPHRRGRRPPPGREAQDGADRDHQGREATKEAPSRRGAPAASDAEHGRDTVVAPRTQKGAGDGCDAAYPAATAIFREDEQTVARQHLVEACGELGAKSRRPGNPEGDTVGEDDVVRAPQDRCPARDERRRLAPPAAAGGCAGSTASQLPVASRIVGQLGLEESARFPLTRSASSSATAQAPAGIAASIATPGSLRRAMRITSSRCSERTRRVEPKSVKATRAIAAPPRQRGRGRSTARPTSRHETGEASGDDAEREGDERGREVGVVVEVLLREQHRADRCAEGEQDEGLERGPRVGADWARRCRGRSARRAPCRGQPSGRGFAGEGHRGRGVAEPDD